MKINRHLLLHILASISMFLTFWFIIFLVFIFKVSILASIIAITGWGFLSIALIYAIFKFHNIEINHISEKIKILSEINMHLESINGYHGELDDGISIYSKMLANKISVPTANIVNSFINSLNGSESLFLIKVDHDTGTWTSRICGEPIHIDAVKWLLSELNDRFEASCERGKSIIWSSKGVHN